MPHPLTGEALASFAALTFLEVILGVDNIVFLAVAVQRLAPEERRTGRWVGLALAMVLRILMLVGLVWATGLDAPLFRALGHAVTIKDLVLAGGGLFLLAKGTGEIDDALESAEPGSEAEVGEGAGREGAGQARWAAMPGVVLQIGLINIVFSLDSVVTAVGMTSDLPIMIAAVVASTLVMVFAAAPVGEFIARRPTTKMLALSFILLIGVALLADGLGFHIPRAYIYFAIAFSLFVEALNGVSRRRAAPGRPRGKGRGA
jgi:predicted tellurium resistance membrane protein TerC